MTNAMISDPSNTRLSLADASRDEGARAKSRAPVVANDELLSHHIPQAYNDPGGESYYRYNNGYISTSINPYDDRDIASKERVRGNNGLYYDNYGPMHGPIVRMPTGSQIGLDDIGKQHRYPIDPISRLEIGSHEELNHATRVGSAHLGPQEEIVPLDTHMQIGHEVTDTPSGSVSFPQSETHIWLDPTESAHEESTPHNRPLGEHMGLGGITAEALIGHPIMESGLRNLGMPNYEPNIGSLGEHHILPHNEHDSNHPFAQGIDHPIAQDINDGIAQDINDGIGYLQTGHGVEHIRVGHEADHPHIGQDHVNDGIDYLQTGHGVEHVYVGQEVDHPHIGHNTGYPSVGHSHTEHLVERPFYPPLEPHPAPHQELHNGPYEGTQLKPIRQPYEIPYDVTGAHLGINLPEIHIWPGTEPYPATHVVSNSVSLEHQYHNDPVSQSGTLYEGVHSYASQSHDAPHQNGPSGARDTLVGKAIIKEQVLNPSTVKNNIKGFQRIEPDKNPKRSEF